MGNIYDCSIVLIEEVSGSFVGLKCKADDPTLVLLVIHSTMVACDLILYLMRRYWECS